MADLKLTFIGSGNAFAPGGLCWNGFVVDDRYLFEAPPQSLMALNRLGLDPNELEAVVISHHHGDHFLGLPFLLMHWKHRGRTAPVKVIGPPQTKAITQEICRNVNPGAFDADYPIEWVELPSGAEASVGDLDLRAAAVQHDERLVLSLGYRCQLGGRTFAYTGDTGLCDAVLEMASDVDVLVSECSSLDSPYPTHMNLHRDIPLVRDAMRPEAELVLTHLAPEISAGGLARTRTAEDYATFLL